jgi:transcriptional regulator with XRE-family HTH domain
MDIGKSIKIMRKNFGFTQVELAKKLNVAQKVISDYEKGKTKPSRDKLPILSSLFGISIDELLGTKEVQHKTINKPIHRNKRVVKAFDMFEKLPAHEQRVVLKQITLLAESIQKKK